LKKLCERIAYVSRTYQYLTSRIGYVSDIFYLFKNNNLIDTLPIRVSERIGSVSVSGAYRIRFDSIFWVSGLHRYKKYTTTKKKQKLYYILIRFILVPYTLTPKRIYIFPSHGIWEHHSFHFFISNFYVYRQL
jgi:hypothetical protein